jgi:hypothetical protein
LICITRIKAAYRAVRARSLWPRPSRRGVSATPCARIHKPLPRKRLPSASAADRVSEGRCKPHACAAPTPVIRRGTGRDRTRGSLGRASPRRCHRRTCAAHLTSNHRDLRPAGALRRCHRPGCRDGDGPCRFSAPVLAGRSASGDPDVNRRWPSRRRRHAPW